MQRGTDHHIPPRLKTCAFDAPPPAIQIYDNPSRTYDGNVGDEYDAWTDEGILEYYWGEHIHLGW